MSSRMIEVHSKYPNVIVNLPKYTVRFKGGVAFIPEEFINTLPPSGYEVITPLVSKDSSSEKKSKSKPKAKKVSKKKKKK